MRGLCRKGVLPALLRCSADHRSQALSSSPGARGTVATASRTGSFLYRCFKHLLAYFSVVVTFLCVLGSSGPESCSPCFSRYRGDRFQDRKGKDLKGNNDLLNLSMPDLMTQIHTEYRTTADGQQGAP